MCLARSKNLSPQGTHICFCNWGQWGNGLHLAVVCGGGWSYFSQQRTAGWLSLEPFAAQEGQTALWGLRGGGGGGHAVCTGFP